MGQGEDRVSDGQQEKYINAFKKTSLLHNFAKGLALT